MNTRTTSALAALFVTLTQAPSAHAQCAVNATDLLVADLTSVSVFSNTGGIVALMPGITLCNVGSANADWSATTAAHPAIVFTLLRYDGAGAFEPIGQSWAHHQSSALQQNYCCACTPAAFGELGAGCSTVSSASAVGTQSALGLRSSIDALSGTLAWPLTNPPPASTSDRRLQVAVADLATPGARYFLEAQIVSGDDAAASNRANNASYREVLVGAGPTFTFTGTTTHGHPAIDAWPIVDANAVVASSTVPGEGGILRLGDSVRDLGDGFHAYEFALHDLDSTAGVRSFSVPIPVGITVRNIEFHGVATHSGDPVDDAPWTVAQAGGMLTWSTTPFATNPLANGLRFGSTIHLRFEANVGPMNGSIELARFRPGTPDTWTIASRVPANSGAAGTICFGDGSGTACPCGNASAIGANVGCLHSLANGGSLRALGFASIAHDTLLLVGSQMPNSSALYFQGTATVGGGAGSVFGDGLRCVGGSVLRLGTKTNVNGASIHPAAGDTLISVASGVSAGDARYFQVWYRNAAAFCTASTFNLTNGLAVTWVP